MVSHKHFWLRPGPEKGKNFAQAAASTVLVTAAHWFSTHHMPIDPVSSTSHVVSPVPAYIGRVRHVVLRQGSTAGRLGAVLIHSIKNALVIHMGMWAR